MRHFRVVRLIPSVILLFAISVPMVRAQDVATDNDPYPLRTADLSSPRATLRTFLTNSSEFIEAMRADANTPATIRAYRRALDTLDPSTTPDRDTYAILTERMLLLKELLDRVELPPENQIPDVKAVAAGHVTEWTVPDTSITIRQIKEGPRAGSFLFSASTVEELARLYRMARHLPYKPGATAGIYEEWLSAGPAMDFERPARERLKPIDTSSPRLTLLGFLESVGRAHKLIVIADAALRSDPPTMTIEEALEIETKADILLRRAGKTLDLSQVPVALRQDTAIESVLHLKEVFDRMDYPLPEAIPDGQMVAAARDGVSGIFSRRATPLRWRYPSTEIEIVEITEGERKGEFLFSANTVAKLRHMYESVQDLPYRSDTADMETAALGYAHLDVTEGFFEYYVSSAGFLIAPAHFLSRFVDNFPPAFKMVYRDQAVWQWTALVLIAIAVLIAAIIVFCVAGWLVRRLTALLGSWLRIVAPTLVALIASGAVVFLDQGVNITGSALANVIFVGQAIAIVMTAWVVYALCLAVAQTIVASSSIEVQSAEAGLLRTIAHFVGFLLGAILIIRGARQLGADVVPLIAGLGVGGLAVALAVRPTLENIFGGLLLFANKPVRPGDFCRYGDQIGTVEYVGWISTRIRSLERTIVTVPNGEFVQMKLDNFGVRDQRLLRTVLQLRYETTEDQLRFVLAKLREMLLGHPMVTPDPARVRFVGFGSHSLDVEVFAYLRCQDQNTFLAIREDVFLRMFSIIKKAGTGFAFPSQTAYLGRDSGLDEDRARTAEEEVAAWRAKGALPFPEFEEQERERLQDTLDYPPKGSPPTEGDESDAALPDESSATGDDRKQARGGEAG